MEAGDWTPEEWAALTADDADPAVQYQPWGPKTLTPAQLADADYIASKLLHGGAQFAGPLGLLANLAVPQPAPGGPLGQRLEQGLDYLGWLTPLLSALSTKRLVYRRGTSQRAPGLETSTPVSDLKRAYQGIKTGLEKPLGEPADYWTERRAPRLGGRTGQGKTAEDYQHDLWRSGHYGDVPEAHLPARPAVPRTYPEGSPWRPATEGMDLPAGTGQRESAEDMLARVLQSLERGERRSDMAARLLQRSGHQP